MQITRRGLLGLGTLLAVRRPSLASLNPTPQSLFVEVSASSSRIHFVHQNAMSENRFLPETLGPGAAFLDFDNDGWMDIYLVNSGPCDFWSPQKPVRNALYKNNRDGTFTDVTEKAGVSGGTFGMGVAVGDYDNDGWPDIFVTSYGRCILYKNNRDGTFSDVTQQAGLAISGWTTSAVWFDYDNDGKLDLFVCSFVDYSGAHKFSCGDNKIGKHYYCIPRVFQGTASFLYRNNGDGTFTDVGKGTAIAHAVGKALGVVATDINNDGRMDLFVANDTVQNFLFVNRGPDSNGHWNWDEIGMEAEVGYSENGQPRSGMGVDAADVNDDGWQDLFVANIDHEKFSVYKNNKNESFADLAHAETIDESTRLLSGWGLKYFDYDNDGEVDLILANGHPDDMVEHYAQQVTYKEPLLLFRHGTDGLLHNVSAQAGSAFQKLWPARGLAIGDYDNDGALDVLVCNNGGAPVLLKNNAAKASNWVGLKLQGVTCNRDAVGAKIYWTAGGKTRMRLKNSGGSYLSSHDVREILGIGEARRIDMLEIHWPAPSTTVDTFKDVPINKYVEVVEGRTKQLK